LAASACCGWLARPGYTTFATFAWFASRIAIVIALTQWRSMRTCSVFRPRRPRYASNGPITLPIAFCMKRSFSAISFDPVISAPPTVSECPPTYFVVECITMSAPSSIGRVSIGVAKVLSTTEIAPALRARAHTAAMSTSFSVGFVGVSSHTIFGLCSRIAASAFERSLRSTCTTL